MPALREDELQRVIEAFVHEVRASPKYRDLDLPESLLRNLISQALVQHPRPREATAVARRKLHQIVAPYLGDPDYQQVSQALATAFAQHDEALLRQVCETILASHISTRERLPFLGDFYRRLFRITGVPKRILDLACGLNPFAYFWMGLPAEAQYYAYDIHHPRVNLINQFFSGLGVKGIALHQDILVHPPQEAAEVAFFFKEIHRFEERQPGCARGFLLSLPVRWILVSLPVQNLSGRYNLLEKQRRLMRRILTGLDWHTEEVLFENEVVFCLQKP
jgi:16S rRNA (guanine(1405)-N(7))-methyltransferase